MTGRETFKTEPLLKTKYNVALFVTCLVDLFRPSVGFASVKLLEDAGCTVSVPSEQTCCGQPAFNSGDRKTTQSIAKAVITNFADFDYIIVPSGSCAGTLKIHYPELFEDDAEWSEKAQSFSSKVYELTSFLVDVLGVTHLSSEYSGSVTYHDSCAGLRELNIKHQPRKLLQAVEGITLQEMENAEVCCGFGGTFCIKYADISNAIVERKAQAITDNGADLLLAGDLGCLMNMAGKLSKQEGVSKAGRPVHVRHIAEVLSGMTNEPAIGQSQPSETLETSKTP